MSTNTRKINKEVTALLCGRVTHILSNHTQYFCETNKAFEIWDVINGLEYRLCRVPKNRVLFVSTDPEMLPTDKWIAEREALLAKRSL